MKKRLKRIAITGGAGAGKSSLCIALSCMGWPILSADEQAKLAWQPFSSIHSDLAELLEQPKGKVLDPLATAHKMFKNPHLKKKVEDIMHPWIYRFIKEAEKLFLDYEAVFYEIPLLFEKNLSSHFDFVVYVDCSESIRKKRILAKKPLWPPSLISAMVKNQTNREFALSKGPHFIITNEASMEELVDKAGILLKKLNLKNHVESH